MKLVSKRKNRAKVEEMVLGFVFNKEHTKIALIKKNRPEWQKDKYNGIGGHVEKKETFQDAMAREFEEEASIFTLPDDWEGFGRMVGIDWDVWLFVLELNDLSKIKSKTDEKIEVFEVDKILNYKKGKLRNDIIPNLYWIIPMAIDFLDNKKVVFADILYR